MHLRITIRDITYHISGLGMGLLNNEDELLNNESETSAPFKMALGKTWNGMDWNGMFGMEWNGLEWNGILSGTFSFHLKPPSTKPDCPPDSNP